MSQIVQWLECSFMEEAGGHEGTFSVRVGSGGIEVYRSSLGMVNSAFL